jgi:hypothetical protein
MVMTIPSGQDLFRACNLASPRIKSPRQGIPGAEPESGERDAKS